ncbi:MAG TPA: 50S ribosomal protein L11 methyltransferase [Methylophilaceae bacterium]|nr:50S ribosomal protein L11 methyltransferase [Methylophilaceae bacterium]
MAWLSLKIEADDQTADLLSDALLDLGAISASIEDAHAETSQEQALFGEPGDPPPGIWQHNVVVALFSEDSSAPDIMHSLEQATGLHDLRYSSELLAEQDWVRATQSQFTPIRIHDSLWIVPSWHDAPDPQALNIVLDPGLAFGTGSHPTTHLCLVWLLQVVNGQHTVLDYGCGSGILAIAAKKMGAKRVIGTDIDAQAIEASRYNAENNHVDAEFYLPDQLPHIQADLVVANILSSALTVLAPALAAACKSGGRIALSGILEPQAQQVAQVYQEWFDMAPPEPMEGWVLLTGIKR